MDERLEQLRGDDAPHQPRLCLQNASESSSTVEACGSEGDEIVVVVEKVIVVQAEHARSLILRESKKAKNGSNQTHFGNQKLHAEKECGNVLSSRVLIGDVNEEEKEGKRGNERHDGGSATAIRAIHVESEESEEEENERGDDESHEKCNGKESDGKRRLLTKTMRGDESELEDDEEKCEELHFILRFAERDGSGVERSRIIHFVLRRRRRR